MPSSTLRHSRLGLSALPQFPYPPSYREDMVLITPLSWQAEGEELTGLAATNAGGATAYPAANRAIGFPFELGDSFLVRKVFWLNGTTATTDACDVGVYSEAGTTLYVSGGSTNIATANVVQEKDCTDTLIPVGRYWCVYAQNGVTATPVSFAPAAALLRAAGCAQFAGAVPLGGTFTPAACASAYLPYFGIAGRTLVA